MTEEAEDDLLGDGIFTAEDKNRYNLRSKSKASQADASTSPAKTAAPVKQKTIHRKISLQNLQRRKHQPLPRRLLLLSVSKLRRFSLLLNSRKIKKPLQAR
jgi:hypothetical protein